MRRGVVWCGVVVALLLATALGWGSTGTTRAQQDDDPNATIAALQTQVADLETRVAALEGSSADQRDEAAPSAPTQPATPQSDASAGTRDNPIPKGDTGTVGDYSVSVVEVIPDAAAQIVAANTVNEPPAEGQQFYMVTVEVTYNGNATGNPAIDLRFRAVGNSGVAYTTFDNRCGTVPNEQVAANELFPGGKTQFNVCWSIAAGDAGSLEMFVEPLINLDSQLLFFAIRPEERG